VSLGKRVRNRSPSVLLQPLGHLSALESRAYEQSPEIIAHADDFRDLPRVPFAISEFDAHEPERARDCVRPLNMPGSLTASYSSWIRAVAAASLAFAGEHRLFAPLGDQFVREGRRLSPSADSPPQGPMLFLRAPAQVKNRVSGRHRLLNDCARAAADRYRLVEPVSTAGGGLDPRLPLSARRQH
jgi:hypothetical protein